MSLYTEAATILTSTTSETGSLRSIIYNSKDGKANRKSAPAALYALITEVAKWDVVLKEVIEGAGLLKLESKLTPIISLLLVHDLLLSKKGIAAPVKHPLRIAVERNKARLQAEFTRARIRRKCSNVEELGKVVLAEKEKDTIAQQGVTRPRWIRINTLKSNVEVQLQATFNNPREVHNLRDLKGEDVVYLDRDIPDVIAFAQSREVIKTTGYNNGDIILQDKASCFPAYLLLESEGGGEIGDVIDACAAPGNKTTHLAAILGKKFSSKGHTIFAIERDPIRSKTLQKMASLAGADSLVKVRVSQDFLALDPKDASFAAITHLLLDPSCSGSGIVGREDIPQLSLPINPRSQVNDIVNDSKKRKRDIAMVNGTTPPAEKPILTPSDPIDSDRLTRLSALQLRIILHAFSFPSATKVTYSTCSTHMTENESVVSRALQSSIARRRGWKVLPRDHHPPGLKEWKHRGGGSTTEEEHGLDEEELKGCIRCYPNNEFGTMGFFVCGFVRDGKEEEGNEAVVLDESVTGETWNGRAIDGIQTIKSHNPAEEQQEEREDSDSDEEWEGFSDQ